MKNINFGRVRIIADREKPKMRELAHSLEENLSHCYAVDSVVLCSECERTRCIVNHQCDIIIALFTEEESETTAAMVAMCADRCKLRGGKIIIVQPKVLERVLPLLEKEVIYLRFEEGDNISVLVLRALCAYYDTLSGRIANFSPENHIRILDQITEAIQATA